MNFYLFCAFFGLSWAAKTAPEVSTSLGRLKGAVMQSRNGREFLAFTKVPFAKPPLGELRFKDPVSPEPWSGVLDASRPHPPCYQFLNNMQVGSEDCLYLNVYTPKTSGSYPVMIYFFGGGWRVGLPGPSTSAKFFMDEDVVLVTINYRLGALGFLSTEDEKIPGNMGLKDMVAAVEWIKRDISNFGGDPNKITAFGLSAGAASAHYLCTLPRSRALLKGCISQSGVGGSHWSLRKPGDAKKTALTVAKAVGCSSEDILTCLQSKTVEEITKTEAKLRFWVEEPLIIHGPVLEPKLDGSLLTEWPVADANFPWLTGVTSREGLFKSMALTHLKDKPIMAEFLEKKEEYLTRMLNLPEGNKNAVRKIAERFFPDNNIEQGIEKLYTEGYFVYPALYELKKHKGPKYFYVFNVTGGPSMWEALLRKKVDTSSGVPHGDDLVFFFDLSFIPGVSKSLMSQTDNVKISEQLIRLWVNFAKYQKPTAEGEQPLWPEFENNGKYVYLSKDSIVEKEFTDMNEILDFWNDIFKTSDQENSLNRSDEL
ncbi:juvenile hormone esterase [Halyomorpha halys]|uniref:juvenile hormone esterase n=1 Tax=Halyomorpha halys TaxID=286706 RepID=UPI0006D4E9B8|nr:venom carboxylesterase-6-like [Halyomorpha halys]XP_024217995.1 venom carboxylesterase-6-like [Halyomorpha halys]